MEELETPIEKIQENIHEIAHHAQENWIGRVALFSALVAVAAAVAALMAGHHSNEAMIKQIKASDAWSFYQAKGIKSSILQSKIETLSALGKNPEEADQNKITDYKNQQEDISEQAKDFEKESEHHLAIHQIFAQAVTLFQVAIAVGAISILTRRKKIIYIGVGFSLLALVFFIQALLQ
ncbi:MAG: DUF4337 domain-containing protein [Moraxellaceae bacterium]|nr:DUF4337 domain-containing protein [Pseudobdellovibrionaceae bacterium]